MSKYLANGIYHFIEFCNTKSEYSQHVHDLVKTISRLCDDRFRAIHEVGCGEGLIIHQLNTLGWMASGNDADPEAVRLAQCLGLDVTLDADITKENRGGAFGAILFSDSLEHIKNWEDHIHWAKSHSNVVVIAVPDRHDAHGLRDFSRSSFNAFFLDWDEVESRTRHVRHLMAYQRREVR